MPLPLPGLSTSWKIVSMLAFGCWHCTTTCVPHGKLGSRTFHTSCRCPFSPSLACLIPLLFAEGLTSSPQIPSLCIRRMKITSDRLALPPTPPLPAFPRPRLGCLSAGLPAVLMQMPQTSIVAWGLEAGGASAPLSCLGPWLSRILLRHPAVHA